MAKKKKPTHPDGKELGSLWDRLMRTPATEESKKAFDESIARENAKALEHVRSTLRLGNIQIEHVTPEVTAEDEKIAFDSELFMQRCQWIKRKPGVYQMAKGFSAHSKGFYMIGQSGCGKSVFAKCFAFQLMTDAGQDVLFKRNFVKFVNFGKLMNALPKDGWIYKFYILDQLHSATHLFIDDIGTEKISEFGESILFDIIDSRLFKVVDDVPLKTYFTSNIAIDDLPYHERLRRRIRDIAAEIVVAQPDNPKPFRLDNALDGNPTNS